MLTLGRREHLECADRSKGPKNATPAHRGRLEPKWLRSVVVVAVVVFVVVVVLTRI